MKLEDIVRKHVLANAVEHNGQANAKSALGSILAENPDLRSQVFQIKSMVEIETDRVNKLSLSQQKRELAKFGGYKKQVVKERKGLIDLPDAKVGKFVVRFAPNPDGALHLGNARPAVLCYEYAKKYRGKFILRFDDTDPKIKVPEKKFYTWIKQDLRWLGVKWSKEVYASKRLSIYYKYAEQAINAGYAYVCECGDKWKSYRDRRRPCPCRSNESKENLKKWKNMLKHRYKEREAVLRIKTDMNDTNPAVRDWPAFRIVDEPKHPLVKGKYVWPLYNFASAIDDHLLGITHILRAQEHATNETKQRYLYDHFGWEYPVTVILGRFSISGMVLSKSEIREGIKNSEFSGWDDPQLGTIRALKRRGFQAETIRDMIMDIGAKPSDITISMENLAAYNRKRIDKIADRFYFVPNPVKIELENRPPIRKAYLAFHPERKSKKKRTFKIGKVFYIDGEDFKRYQGLEIRLKGLFNIKLRKDKKCKFTSLELKNIPKIQWVPKEHVEVKVIMPRKTIRGYAETNIKKVKVGDIVQFERFGFVRIERTGKNIVAVFGHK